MDLIFYFGYYFYFYFYRLHFGDCHEWLLSNWLLARCTFLDLLISDYRFTQITLSTEHFYFHSPFKCYICLVRSLAFWRLPQINICKIHCENKTNKFVWKYFSLLHSKRYKSPTCFRHFLGPSSSWWFTKAISQRYQIYLMFIGPCIILIVE